MAKKKTGQNTVTPPAQTGPVGPHAALEAPEIPTLTPDLAEVFAQMLEAGCPPLHAAAYIAPELDKDTIKTLAKSWLNSELVFAAIERMNGGNWMTLAPEKRYELSLRKHLSEMAYYLHANNFNDVEHKEGLEKMKQAREMLRLELKGETDDTDPQNAWARFAMELMKDKAEKAAAGKSIKPPQLTPPGMDRIHREMTAVTITPKES